MGSKRPDFGDGASPGKIFIGGLAKDTTFDTFVKYFSKYGEVTDSVVMKDRQTGRPRGFGFITYADPSVVDTVIAETHVINGKQVEIKRTIPKGGSETRDFKTRKIFVGGIPSSVNEDELKDFFSNYGNVVEHEIIREHASKRSRGFGFIVFESEEVVENLVAGGNKIDMAGTQVEIKKAEPKKPSNSAPRNAYGNEPRGRAYGEDFGGFGNSYSGFGSGRLGSASYRSFGGGIGGRFGGDYGGYGGGRGGEEFGGRYGNFGGYRGEQPSFDDSSRFGSYSGGGGGGGGGYGGGFGGGSSAYGGYGRGGGGSYGGGYGGGGYAGASFESGLGAGPAGFEPGGGGYGGGGGLYGSRGGYGGSGGGGSAGRYHPYSR